MRMSSPSIVMVRLAVGYFRIDEFAVMLFEPASSSLGLAHEP